MGERGEVCRAAGCLTTCPVFSLVEEVARDTTLKTLFPFGMCPELLLGTLSMSGETSQWGGGAEERKENQSCCLRISFASAVAR